MIHPTHYKNYVGQYVKRFYRPFTEETIHKIAGFKLNEYGTPLFHYTKEGQEEEYEDWWLDCEDSCIITNEFPVQVIAWVANVNDPQYKGYNPFTKQIQ